MYSRWRILAPALLGLVSGGLPAPTQPKAPMVLMTYALAYRDRRRV